MAEVSDVLAGSWKGAVVAVKVIMHNTSMARKVDTLRESLVGISMQHPHVVRRRCLIVSTMRPFASRGACL